MAQIIYTKQAQTRTGYPNKIDLKHTGDGVSIIADDDEIVIVQRDDIRTVSHPAIPPFPAAPDNNWTGYPKTTIYALVGNKLFADHANDLDWASYGQKPDKVIQGTLDIVMEDEQDWFNHTINTNTNDIVHNRFVVTINDDFKLALNEKTGEFEAKRDLIKLPPPKGPATDFWTQYGGIVIAVGVIVTVAVIGVVAWNIYGKKKAPAQEAPADGS